MLPLLVLLVILALSGATAAPIKLSPPSETITKEFFGQHIHRLGQQTTWPAVPFGRWRLWDAHVTWPDLETPKGTWHFQQLDVFVNAAEAHNVQVLLVLGWSPTWASARPAEKSATHPGYAAEPNDLEDWRTYVRTVATRYKGRIHYYEIWNEPNLKQFYTGDVDHLVALTGEAFEVLKAVDPANMVVSPSATSGLAGAKWLDSFLKKGGGKYVEIIGFHFYVAPRGPEAMLQNIADVHSVMSDNGVGAKPLWDTETGWTIQSEQNPVALANAMGVVLNAEQAAAYIGRSYVLSWAAGVASFFWYSWDNYYMGLVEPDGKTLKPAATAYGEVEQWLVGAKMTACGSDATGLWTCTIVRPNGYSGWLLWNPEKTYNFSVPKAWGVTHVRDLSGAARTFSDGQVPISPSPLLLEKTR